MHRGGEQAQDQWQTQGQDDAFDKLSSSCRSRPAANSVDNVFDAQESFARDVLGATAPPVADEADSECSLAEQFDCTPREAVRTVAALSTADALLNDERDAVP